MNKLTLAGIVGVLVVVGISIAYAMGVLPKREQAPPSDRENFSLRSEAQDQSKGQGEGAGIAAMAQAAQEKKYLFMLDPSDPAEKPFLTDLKIDPATTEAITAFMAPPGSVIAEIKGATNKEELVAALQKASSACGSGGCAPGSCGPQK
jgi:hypothetical protein